MASADVTRRELSLGDRDGTTGWPSKTYAETTIKGSFDPATARAVALSVGMPLGGIPYMSSPFYTGNLVARGDRIEHAVLGEYELVNVVPITWLDQFVMYACQAEKVMAPADRAATSGTWHTDSEAIKTDPRNRIKAWLDQWLPTVPYTVCDYEVIFAGGDYPFEREFTLLGNEIVSAVDVEQSTPEYTYDHHPYKFNEVCTITNTAIDTATLTATNILESFEQAIRDVATDYPLGSIRRITSSKPNRVNIGGMWLWQNTITIDYERANDDYIATLPKITWGPSTASSGTFIFPNVIDIQYPNDVPNVKLLPPSRIGNVNQRMGDTSLIVKIVCDLDFEHPALTWKRSQTTTKTDKFPWQVILDIKHNGGITQPYQTLKLDWCATTGFPVTLEDFNVRYEGDRTLLEVTFQEYNATSASTQTVVERYNIS
jgi:hypothetical protein